MEGNIEGEGEIGLGKLSINRKKAEEYSANLISLFFFSTFRLISPLSTFPST